MMYDIRMNSYDTLHWRALYCAPSCEISIYDEFVRSGFESFCPRYVLIVPRRGRPAALGEEPIKKTIPFLRSYLFARFDPNDAAIWHMVNGIKGIRRIIPGVVLDQEILDIASLIGSDGSLTFDGERYVKNVQLSPGDHVHICDGMFSGHSGTIEAIELQSLSVIVKTSLLGRQVLLNQPSAWCERVTDAEHQDRKAKRRRLRTAHRGRSRHRYLRGAYSASGVIGNGGSLE
jgi:transcription antitermination factor NusG